MSRTASVVSRLPPVWVLAASFAAGLAYVAVIPPGLPYDEPSHWANVLFVLERQQLPELGDAGVSYEAQMGPVAYVLDAVVAASLHAGSETAAFYAVRTVGLLVHLGLVLLVWRLAGRCLPGRPAVATGAAVALGLNPMLLSMSTSVQNDSLALLLAFAALDVSRPGASWRRSTAAGLLAGAALLTKITVWPLLVVLCGMWLLARRWCAAAVFTLTATLVSGWWFVRNIVLYGDVTARAGVEAAGFSFPASDGFAPVAVLKSIMTYLWVPTEYVRNEVVLPTALDLVVAAITGAGLLGGALLLLRDRPRGWWMEAGVAVGVLAPAAWLITTLTTQAVAFRFAYIALPVWFLMLGRFLEGVPRRSGPLALAAVLAALNAWFLVQVATLPALPVEIPFA